MIENLVGRRMFDDFMKPGVPAFDVVEGVFYLSRLSPRFLDVEGVLVCNCPGDELLL